MKTLEGWCNSVFFFLRSHLRWSWPSYAPANEEKETWLADHPVAREAFHLLGPRFDLEDFASHSTLEEFKESMYVLELMNQVFPRGFEGASITALDVGSKSFAYAQGLYRFYERAGDGVPRQVSLTGIECDAFRVYRDLHSRFDYARHHIRGLERCRYLSVDVETHVEKYRFITWFLPFVTEYALRKWGLPPASFRPEVLLAHVYSLLEPGGIMVIANRKEEERDLQAQQLRRANLSFSPFVPFLSEWLPHPVRYVTLVRKGGEMTGGGAEGHR